MFKTVINFLKKVPWWIYTALATVGVALYLGLEAIPSWVLKGRKEEIDKQLQSNAAELDKVLSDKKQQLSDIDEKRHDVEVRSAAERAKLDAADDITDTQQQSNYLIKRFREHIKRLKDRRGQV